jgi:alpha-beta hydrolase superfamily lysophospholipase
MSRQVLHRVRLAAAALPLLALALWAGAIAFDSPAPPRVVPGGGAIPGIGDWDKAEIPAVQKVIARDGTPLTYRAYPGRPDRIALLLHGSTGTSLDMHKVAMALQAAGATAYAISLRGHGGSGGAAGDVSYVGQLDDDLADFLKALGLDKAGQKRSLVGFSAGGGFTLRVASGPMGGAFDDYIAISPYIASFTDLRGRHLGGWANRATFRVVGLLALERLGIHAFEDLPVVRYAVDPVPDDRHTPGYSYRLQRSMHADDWRRDFARIAVPTVLLTSDEDDLTNADRLGRLGNPKVSFREVKGLAHDQMVVDPRALAEIVAIWRDLNER